MPRRAEAAVAARRAGQLRDLDDAPGDGHDDELRDAHPGLDRERLGRVGVEQDHPELAAVAGVDQARRVDDREAVPGREPGARHDEACVALGDRDRDPGRHDRALAGLQRDALTGGEIEPCVARVGPRRQHGVLP